MFNMFVGTSKERVLKKWTEGFKQFALGSDLVEVGVGLVMAIALAALIQSLVENILMPIVAAIFGEPDFSTLWRVDIGDSTINFGTFVTASITFLSIAFAVYFFVVKPWMAYKARVAAGEEDTPAAPSEVDLLIEIRDALAK